MPAVAQILCSPPGSGKSRRLRELFVQHSRRRPGSALWLGPTPRAVEVVRAQLLAAAGALVAPRLYAFSDFFDALIQHNDPTARPLTPAQQWLLAEEIVERLRQEDQLAYFGPVLETRGFLAGLLRLLADLKRQQVSPRQLADALGGVGGSPRDRDCVHLYQQYEQALQRLRLTDLEGRPAHALNLLERGLWQPFGAVRVVLVDGFTDFTAAQYQALRLLAERAEEMWIALPDEAGDLRAELFSTPRTTAQRLGSVLGVAHSPLSLQGEGLGVRGRISPLSLEGEGLGVRGRISPLSPVLGGEGSGVRGRSSRQPTPLTPDPSPCRERRGRGEPSPSRERGEKGEPEPILPLPPGLVHLAQQLFRPQHALQRSDHANGVTCLEAPGQVGEARMVARRIKGLLLEGVPPGQILVTLREVAPQADLLQEIFEDYGLPLDLEGSAPLTHQPAVAVLLRSARLAEDDWPFAAVTALLRNTYFRPDWPETRADPEVAQHAEALLRLLGEPRDRQAYLHAIARWAAEQQPGLEDEQAEESRRRRTHQLAQRCQPFLQHLFQAWDQAPGLAPLHDHVEWLRNLGADLGITRAVLDNPRDRAALALYWEEIDSWQQRGTAGRLERKAFHHALNAVAAAAGLPRTSHGPGRVRVLSAESARHLEADHLFLMGLGERSFPRLALPPALLDDPDRQTLKQAGVELPGSADLLPGEMLLFYQLVTRARRSLTLSYPAVDERGQSLLPSSFLTAVLDCFAPQTVPRESQRMLIERYHQDVPLSPAEYRVQLAARGPELLASAPELPEALRANLADAARLNVHRFHDRQHNAYDGRLRDPALLAELVQQFGPQRVLSPTALEDYITCPYRFFLTHVLRLAPLDEPREEIEVTRRGQAFHRALARLHRALKAEEIHQPEERLDQDIAQHLTTAVQEDVHRAPSPAAKELWRLEGQRLLRLAALYRDHWGKFIEPWLEHGIRPRPHLFEIDFGLPPENDAVVPHGPLVITADGLEVRLSGRIDRIDLAELPDGSIGFWIIDYKTGRAGNYTGTDLAGFRRLQLTLYALAVQDVLLAGQAARPLGLAYWLVGDSGAKIALPGRKETLWLTETARWGQVREKLADLILDLVRHIRGGEFPLHPRDEHCTQTCDFGQMCRITQARALDREWSFSLPVLSSSTPASS